MTYSPHTVPKAFQSSYAERSRMHGPKDQLEVLVDFESHEGDNIRVLAGPETRTGILYTYTSSGEERERNKRFEQFSAKVYVNKRLAKVYRGGDDLSESWIPIVDAKLQELADGRAGAEEVVYGINTIIAELAEKHHRAVDALPQVAEEDFLYDGSKIFVESDEEVF